MEPCKVCRPVFADWHYVDQEQDSAPDPQQSEKSDPDKHQSYKRDPDPHQSNEDPQN
jgi:hypothetical protein